MSFTKIYWRSSGIPTWGLLFLTFAAILIFLAAENMQKRDPLVSDNYTTMVSAAKNMSEAMELIKTKRAQIEPINPDYDPQRSGWLGIPASSVTSVHGARESKMTTLNPNWAAVAVKLLAQAGVEKGDLVAVTVSGSFPALNLAVYSAVEAMGAEAIVIASASASQWGANVPDLLWVDMERELRSAGLIKLKPIAASMGGIEDRGVGLSKEGLSTIRGAIDEAGIPFLDPKNYQEAVANRIALFREHSNGREIKAFVNVGGGATIVGPAGIDDLFGEGYITDAPARAFAVQTVMGYFLQEGVPGIQFISIKDLAERYGLPIAPPEAVPVGNGDIYTASTYRRWLAAVLALALFGLTWLIVRSSRITSVWRKSSHADSGIKPMV
ncbi:poly-gamma-glutamate system protein [Idiomarina xiamenensis]|uniref:Poly-gamma-glutamate system protein n=1 Tax=Idiomarina xiamenensis 10-D-4 TaxID=740709 RepID=K2KPQ2_9GAMM|nr:poly-gamma-glutamate system protein [Idiomarina xiamenensis]EKE84439.1 hypothetical protein A10D4_05207 [Idiomarina xiamenensis 10-D-4]